jgi:hypothetical protein
MIKPANKNGRTRVVHQNLLKRCFGNKFIGSACNDVQLLTEKNKRGRPKKNIKLTEQSLVNVNVENNVEGVVDLNTDFDYNSKVIKNKRGRPKKNINLNEQSPVNVNLEKNEPSLELSNNSKVINSENNKESLRKSTRVTKQPNRYIA